MLLLLFLSIFSAQETQGMIDEIEALNISTANWTTCEQFLRSSSFDRAGVVDVDWVIFYFWSLKFEQTYHIRYSVPGDVLVDRFRIELTKVISPSVNWSASEMFLETSIDLSGLFIRTELPGKFRFIPSLAFQYHSTPLLFFGVKLVDEILGMINCQQQVAYALAPVEVLHKMTPADIEAAAKKIGFWNPFGRSYLMKSKSFEVDAPPLPPFEELDDAEDDIQVEIDKEKNQFQII